MHDFEASLAWSKTSKQFDSDFSAIMEMLDGCVGVVAAPVHLDKIGVDYIATLRGGADVMIDAKARRAGASRQRGWDAENPLLAIEVWSVAPGGKYDTKRPKTGWTLDEGKVTDMILSTFDPSDSRIRVLLPFQSLRIATRRNIKRWIAVFGLRIQDNNRFESQCVFVPLEDVTTAIDSCYSSALMADEFQGEELFDIETLNQISGQSLI